MTEHKQTRRKMPKKSNVWKYFTRLPSTDDSGNKVWKARCNKCNREFKASAGTTNLWRHFLKDFTTDVQGGEKVVRCNVCQSTMEASGPTASLVEHVVACIERQNAASVGESRLPPMQTRAPPASGSSSMDIDPADMGAQPPPSVQTSAPTASSGSLSMDLERADLLEQPPPPSSAPSCPAESSLDGDPGMDESSKHLARMIALRGYDPSIVDDDYFRSFLGSLKPEFKMPSRVKIEEECDHISDEARGDLLSRLSSSRGRVSLAVGRTKIVEKKLEYVACHYIDDEWVLRKLVLGAFMAGDDANFFIGPILGVHLVLGSYDKLDRILGCISDHSISNRLFALTHDGILRNALKNYIVEKIYYTTYTTREIFFPTYMDKELHAIAECFNSCESLQFDLYMDIPKLHLTRKEQQQLISHLDLDDPWMYRDETWYQMYCSLKVIRVFSSSATDTNSFRELWCKVCGREHHAMSNYNDSTSEVLCKVWGKIHHAIRRISASSYPTSHLCLEMLLDIWRFLHSELALVLVLANIDDGKDNLSKARETLDEAVKNSYLVWSIPLALDPRYKLEGISDIFKEAFESEVATEYISEVTKRMMQLYNYYKKDEDGTSIGAGHSDSGVVVAAGGDDGDDPMHQLHQPYQEAEWERYFDDLHQPYQEAEWERYFDDLHQPYQEAEWERYFDEPVPLAEDFDILKWWKGNGQKYPTLARMARDVLAMPTCSKPSSDEIAQIRSIVRCYSNKGFIR